MPRVGRQKTIFTIVMGEKNMLNILKRSQLLLLALPFALPGYITVAQAQNQGADEAIEEIITTGTRRAARTAADSPVAVDVITGQEFENMGSPDLDEMLRTSLPSYNVQRHEIDDAASLVRPATMRGLPPDNVLVLVNGKRRHRSAVIAELGSSLNEGSQGTDLMAIPPMAIKQLEVLRDGASAQYGSDAIAGVMNFVLKDDTDGLTFEGRWGEYMEGDGQLIQFGANAGFPLGDNGFANITASWMEQDPTSRSTQRTDAATLIASGAPEQQANVRQPYAQIWGSPEYRSNWNIFLNSGIDLGNSQEVYVFGNVGRRETEGGFFYRNPNDRSGVFTFDVDGVGGASDVTYRAIVDTNISPGDTNVISNCPALISPGSGSSGTPLDPTAVADDSLARANLPANCFVANTLLPGGYTPQFGGNLEDSSIVLGFRGEMANGIGYDLSGSVGRNQVAFFLNNTWNPSLGPDGVVDGALQRDFRIGSYTQTETNLNVDFVWPLDIGNFASPVNFAFGGEYRVEEFRVEIGETNSWDAGDFAFQSGQGTNCYDDPNVAGLQCFIDQNGDVLNMANLSIGAHGFAGFSPSQAGTFDRGNYAVYADLEADITDNFTLGAAIRFEDFDDFGTTTNGKLAARLAITDNFALRGSASTGFRAPTPGQSNVTKVSTVTIAGELQQQGQIPPTNPIAVFLGATPLEPEEATNFTLGAVWDVTDALSLTLDFYQINVDDRISLTGTIEVGGEPVPAGVNCPLAQANPTATLSDCLQELGVPGAADLNSVAFYSNDFETTTTGLDLVATWAMDWGNAGNGDLTVAWNWTEQELDFAGSIVDRDKAVDLENLNPQNRGVFTYQHFVGDFRFLARASFYDDWVEGDFSDDDPANPINYTIDCTIGNDNCYDGDVIFDLEAAYAFTDNFSVIVGAQNIADEFGPGDNDHLDGTVGSGNTLDNTIPWDSNGGFWYLRLRADFE